MHFRKLLLVVIAVVVVTFSVGVQGQGLIDGIRVTLPESVTVGDKVLEPGEYEIRRPSSANRDILQIFNKGKMVYETNVLTVATGPDEKDPKETKVILHRIGDAHYFDKIWMEDRNYGWEFPLPERVRALQRENSLNVAAARYEPSQVTTSEPYSGPGLAAQLDAIAEQDAGPGLAAQLDVIAEQDDQQALALAESESQARMERERQEQADRDRQAELDRQAQLDRERQSQADRDQAAALQTEESEVQVAQSRDSEAPEELPRTATNWLALIFGGLALVAVSFFVRPARAQE
jgi:hypothetical protein